MIGKVTEELTLYIKGPLKDFVHNFRLETTRSLVTRYTTDKNTVILENVKLHGLTSFVLHKNQD